MPTQAGLDILRCPRDGERLVAATDGPARAPTSGWRCAGGHPINADEGIVRLVWPERMMSRDAHMNRMYERLAPFYDWNERLGGRLFGVHTIRERAAIVDRLGLRPGMRVLEVSPGPGVYQKLLADRIGPSGNLAELDLSLAMLRACARRARRAGNRLDPLLVQANASYLPFADDSFDAVFHFGGVKLFSEPGRALDELVRVAKPDAVVAWGDEGFGAGAPTGWRRRALQRMNPGFAQPVPPLPEGVSDVTEHEVMNGCAWLVVARKAAVGSERAAAL
jgi:ubiquinone/menaquinone biosynthesis C-methylase UbiE